MSGFFPIIEIPATQLDRAIRFYGTILDISIERIDLPGMSMGLFPSEGQQTFGLIVQGGGQTPSREGVTVYLHGGEDLQVVLSKVEENGGHLLTPKTALADESGFYALFIDTEGNRLGLHSPT